MTDISQYFDFTDKPDPTISELTDGLSPLSAFYFGVEWGEIVRRLIHLSRKGQAGDVLRFTVNQLNRDPLAMAAARLDLKTKAVFAEDDARWVVLEFRK